MIETFEFQSEIPGPTMLLLGGVHGDEPCGTLALRKILAEFQSGRQRLEQGKLIIVPVCNPLAFERKTRQIDRNLNRSLYPKDDPQTYEDHIGNALCPILEQADVLVDLHSYSSGKEPFALVEQPDEENIKAVAGLGIKDLVYGWSDVYGKNPKADPKESQGTTEYARLHGALAITVECGVHQDPNSVVVAERVARAALSHFGFVAQPAPVLPSLTVHHMEKVEFKDREGQFSRNWTHFQHVAQGEEIAHYADGEKLYSPIDGVIVMPKPWARIRDRGDSRDKGEEWYYVATAAKTRVLGG